MTFEVHQPSGLLEFLLLSIKGKSRNNIKSILFRGQVLVDETVETQFDLSLRPGQTITILHFATKGKKAEILPDIIYEDDDFIVINKPAGLVSVATDQERVNTAYTMVLGYLRRINALNRAFVVHRIDRDTSGILVFAKSEKVKNALQNDWAELATERGYIAVVEGQLKDKSGTVKSWLRQTKTLVMYSSYTPGDGLEAITEYQVLKESMGYSMLAIQLGTGRKNQIRVHMKDLEHSVVGDKKYGATTNPLNRLGLHSSKLTLVHPFSSQTLRFSAPIPASFNKFFK